MLDSYSQGGATWEMVVVRKKSQSSELLWTAMSRNSGVMHLQPVFRASSPASSRTLAVMYWMMAARKMGADQFRRWA